jgi:hypothetical protein
VRPEYGEHWHEPDNWTLGPSGAKPPSPPGDVHRRTFAECFAATGAIWTVYYLLILPIGIGFLSHAYRHFFRPQGSAQS